MRGNELVLRGGWKLRVEPGKTWGSSGVGEKQKSLLPGRGLLMRQKESDMNWMHTQPKTSQNPRKSIKCYLFSAQTVGAASVSACSLD